MPIRRDYRQFYGKEWRDVIRPKILKRAKNKCEQCGKPNGTDVESGHFEGRMWWRQFALSDGGCAWVSFWRNHHGKKETVPEFARRSDSRVVLTIAHLNHVAGDDRDENLKALCQWCHLNYDKLHHKETRSTRKDAARPLLVEAACS